MKKIAMIAAFAIAVLSVSPAMAQQGNNGKGKANAYGKMKNADRGNRNGQGMGENRTMRDPRTRSQMMADKLDFTAQQRAQLDALNAKYAGTDVDRKAYHQEFMNILTPAQRDNVQQMRQQHGQKGQRGNRNGNGQGNRIRG